MNNELEFLEEKYGHNSWNNYPPSKQQVAQWLQEWTEKQFDINGVSNNEADEIDLDFLVKFPVKKTTTYKLVKKESEVAVKFKDFVNKQQDLDKETVDIINNNFWDLI